MRTTSPGWAQALDVSPAWTPPSTAPSPWDAYWTALGARAALGDEASLYVARLRRVVDLTRHRHVLDFGCGFGLVAAALAAQVDTLCLWDRSPTMQRRAASEVAGLRNVSVVATLPRTPAFDLILVNSVVQYMPPEERRAWLSYWRQLVRPFGSVVVSDVPVETSTMSRIRELAEVVMFHRSRSGVCRIFRERAADALAYWRTVRAAPLTPLPRATLEREAAAAGFAVTILPGNLTCRRRRLAAILHPMPTLS
jgi:protein-L-isoaspartate O-methyltransferase